MDFTRYQLPDGSIVNVDATAAKGAPVIGYTLKCGRQVDAVIVPSEPRQCHYCLFMRDLPDAPLNAEGYCPICMKLGRQC